MRYAIAGRSLRITDQDAQATWKTADNQLKGLKAYNAVPDHLGGIARLTFGLVSIALGAGLTVLMIPGGPLAEIGTVGSSLLQ